MKVVLGLGNPGAEYAGNRHNVGFRVVDALARRHGGSFRRADSVTDLAHVARTSIEGEEVLLAKPKTYMNRSGRAASAVLRVARVTEAELLVVYDDADLALGRIRLRAEGSAGGHNGLRSLLATLPSPAFIRVKLGVRGTGRESMDLADYVLQDFDPEERPVVGALVEAGADAVESVVAVGLAAAMNRFNGFAASAPGPG